MTLNFRKLMTPEQNARYDAQIQWHAREITKVKALSDSNLVAAVDYCMSQMERVRKWVPGDPVYDAQLFHVFIPELLRRVGKLDNLECGEGVL